MQAALGVAWVILWILAAALLVGAIAYFVVLAMVGAGALDPAILAPNENTRVQIPGLTLDNPAGAIWPVVVPALLIGGVAIGGGLVIVGRLKRLFDNFTSGEPFRRENASHLRAIWIAMLAIELSRYALLALTGVLLAAFGPDDIQGTLSLNIDISTWASILILIVLAEVFREGARLKEEQELTI
jgi:hypothetical protein